MGIIDGGKKLAQGFQKTVQRISGAIKFFSTYVGWVVGALLIIIFLVIALVVLVNTIGHAIAEFFGDEVGISTDADYEYMVSSLGYAGYDSLISEKNFQEYLAYEYAVLMDVAEYLYKGQKEYDEAGGDNAYAAGTAPGPATMPYISVQSPDFTKLTDEQWRRMIVAGQGAERPVTAFDDDILAVIDNQKRTLIGGNQYVSRPVISYEFKLSSFEPDQGSLVPYITVVRDDLKYHYYSVGGYSWTFSEGDAVIDASNVSNVNLLKINYGLNANNGALPTSYDYTNREIKKAGNAEGLNTSSSENWPKAETNFGTELYFNDTYDSVVYKMTLQTLIDRYLPKANLLTSWFLLKDNDSASGEATGKKPASGFENKDHSFNIDMLMKDIKGIYNYYCWGDESLATEKVMSVKYNETDGTVERDASGEAIKEEVSKRYATTDNKTFMTFQQIGLETNRYEVYKEYKPTESSASTTTRMPRAYEHVTGDATETTIPVVTDLLSKSAYFLNKIDVTVEYSYKYIYEYYDSGDNCIKSGESTGYGTADAEDYLSSDVTGRNETFSDMIMQTVIKPAEEEMAGFTKFDRGVQQDFVNYEYVFPTKTEEDGGAIKAEAPQSFYDSSYKDNLLAFYNFGVAANAESTFKTKLESGIDNLRVSDVKDSVSITVQKPSRFERWSGDSWVDKTSFSASAVGAPRDAKYEVRTVKAGSIKVTDVECGAITFDRVYDCVDGEHNPNRAVFDVTEVKIDMSLTILQKRMSAVLVKTAETWAKSATYDFNIIQESFEPFNEKYVIPHNGRNFGILQFDIVENPKYRTEYYKDYFSKPRNAEPGVKEADVLSMMMTWEEYGVKGIESAYNFMRDLYKLIMYTREKGKDFEENPSAYSRPSFFTDPVGYLAWRNPYILKNAYTYLYVPETIWSFREGKTQEVFWIERLVAKEYGNPDVLTLEEQEKVVTKNEEISWQLLDYEDYEECAEGEDKTKVYALFPYGSSWVRTDYMERALKDGVFDDGGNTPGHLAVDWHGRYQMLEMLQAGKDGDTSSIAGKIYDQEVRSRTLINIINGVGGEDDKRTWATEFMNLANLTSVSPNVQVAYNKAKASLDEELNKTYIESPIVAIAPGLVTSAGYNARSGFKVSIRHTDDQVVTSSYCHFRRWPLVNPGDIVGAGTVLGYEGDTGNSTGSHLHFQLTTGEVVGGTKYDNSPSSYLAPIYTPFYNAEKITEFLAAHKDYNKDKLILSTDYMSLARTVLLARFDSNGSIASITTPDATLLESVSLIQVTDSTDPAENGEYMYVKNDGGMKYMSYKDEATGQYICIIKTGVQPNEQYFKCTFDVVDNSKIVDGKIVRDIFNDGRTFKIITKEPVSKSAITLQGIQVQVSPGQTETAQVNWGITTPLRALVPTDKFDKLINKGIFDGEKEFDASADWQVNTDNPGDGDEIRTGGWNKKEKDVRAWSKLFDASSAEVQERLKSAYSSPESFIAFSDTRIAGTVPFYEGPFTKAYSEQTLEPGAYGALTEDLALLQSAIKASGIAGDLAKDMNTEGIYDDLTVEVFKAVGAYIASNTDLDSYISSMTSDGAAGVRLGETLDSGGKHPYSIRSIVAWNTYLAYGSLANAQSTADQAIKYASEHYQSVHPMTFVAIANCESGRVPSIESDHLYSEDMIIDLNFTTNRNETYIYDFKGTERIVRRAQGLFQVLPETGRGYIYAGASDEVLLETLRSPYSNALIGGALLDSARRNLEINHMQDILDIANQPNWQNLGKEAGQDPVQLVLNAMMALSLNKGQAGALTRMAELKNMTYERYDGNKFKIMNCPNYTGKVVGSICNGAMDWTSPKDPNADL